MNGPNLEMSGGDFKPYSRQSANRRRAAILARLEQQRRRSVAIEAAKSLLFGFVVPVVGAAAGLC